MKSAEIIPFPKKNSKTLKLPNVGAYPDFLTGVNDLQSRVKANELSDELYKKLYMDLLHRFMKKN